jgi:predicted ArsR family transcriptional regulator
MNKKKQLMDTLLDELSRRPMNRQDMADFLGVTVIFISRYITELRTKRLIYIDYYQRTPQGKPKSFYKTGNLPDAEELPPIPMRILQKKYREKTKRVLSPNKFQARMDIAASWMFNPK